MKIIRGHFLDKGDTGKCLLCICNDILEEEFNHVDYKFILTSYYHYKIIQCILISIVCRDV